jgi:hypothetical protein
MTKNQKISRNVNGVTVEQRVTDGFINGTAMCIAHGKLIADWFRNQETIELLHALVLDFGLEINYGISHNSGIASISAIYPQLVVSKRGSPENGGGTWLHPDLAIQLAQWCNKPFAIQVSRWVREWMTTGQNPIWSQADIDRVEYRDALKDEARLRMTDQVKIYLEQIRRYDDNKYRGIFFAKVHDGLNILITTETSRQMRVRLSQLLGKEVKECELIRDYFPAIVLQRYISMCEAAANLMIREGLQPLSAVERAAEIVLPANYLPVPIDFDEHIRLVCCRLNGLQSGQRSLNFF